MIIHKPYARPSCCPYGVATQCLAKAASSASLIVRNTLIRAKRLSLASTSVQGAICVLVRSTISPTASRYCGHFSRLRQSSSVILKRLNGICSRALKAFQLGLLIDRQPELHQHHTGFTELLLEVIDLAIGAQPVPRAAEAFDPLHQHPPIPGTIKYGELATCGNVPPEAPQVGLRAAPLQSARQPARCGTGAGQARR